MGSTLETVVFYFLAAFIIAMSIMTDIAIINAAKK